MSDDRTIAPRVVIAAASLSFEAAVAVALSHHFDLQFCKPGLDEVSASADSAHVALLEYGQAIDRAVEAFEHLTKRHPRLPILLALEAPPTEQVIELLKCGVADIVLLPTSTTAFNEVLCRKVLRAVSDATWPALDVPGLSQKPPELKTRGASDSTPSRRRSYRADLEGTRSAWIAVQSGREMLRFFLRDFSIGQDTWHGGLSFRAPDGHWEKTPFAQAKAGGRIDAWLYLEGTRSGIPIDFTCRRLRQIPGGWEIAGQYKASHVRDERVIRHFWVAAQRNQLKKQK